MAVAGPVHADSAAEAAAGGSPGLISGNGIQLPVHVPVNVREHRERGRAAQPAMGNRRAKRRPPRRREGGARGVGQGHGARHHTRLARRDLRQRHPALVDLPVNVSGNTVNVVGIGNPVFGNESVNGPGDRPEEPGRTTPPAPKPEPPTRVTPPVHSEPPHRARPHHPPTAHSLPKPKPDPVVVRSRPAPWRAPGRTPPGCRRREPGLRHTGRDGAAPALPVPGVRPGGADPGRGAPAGTGQAPTRGDGGPSAGRRDGEGLRRDSEGAGPRRVPVRRAASRPGRRRPRPRPGRVVAREGRRRARPPAQHSSRAPQQLDIPQLCAAAAAHPTAVRHSSRGPRSPRAAAAPPSRDCLPARRVTTP